MAKLKITGKDNFFNVRFGYLYNWFAVSGSTGQGVKSLSSSGWHVPDGYDFAALTITIGGTIHDSYFPNIPNTLSNNLKEIGTTYWNPPNTDADNLYLFNSRGSGIRMNTTGIFGGIGGTVTYWAFDTTDFTIALGYTLTEMNTNFYANMYGGQALTNGSSVRLVKDQTILSDGETGIYIGNDGKKYKTICIGTQEWLSVDLCETKLRDGTLIPEVTNNNTWINLTTGARCSYNNDESYSFLSTTFKNTMKLSGDSGKIQSLNFNNDVFVDLSTEVVLDGLTEPISFYMYLDSNNYVNHSAIIYSSPYTDTISRDILIVFLYNNYLWVQCGEGNSEAKKVDITNFSNQVLFIEIKRTNTAIAADVTYIKFNGVEQTLLSVDMYIGIFQEFNIGTILNLNNMEYIFKLYDATIWDLRIPQRNYWKGYTGNLDSGWVDQIGSNNGSVIGTTKTTRKVTIPKNRKLKLIN